MKSSPFIMVEHDAIEDLRISGEAFRLYCYLLKCAGNRDVAYPSQETLADKFEVSIRTIKARIAELKNHGLIRVEQRGDGKQANIYLDKPTYSTRKKECSGVQESAPSENSGVQNFARKECSGVQNSARLYNVEKETVLEKETAATCARTHATDDQSSATPKQPETPSERSCSDIAAASSVFPSDREEPRKDRLLRDHTLAELEALRRRSARAFIARFIAEEPTAYEKHKPEILRAGERSQDALVGQAVKIARDVVPGLKADEQAIEAEKRRRQNEDEMNRRKLQALRETITMGDPEKLARHGKADPANGLFYGMKLPEILAYKREAREKQGLSTVGVPA